MPYHTPGMTPQAPQASTQVPAMQGAPPSGPARGGTMSRAPSSFNQTPPPQFRAGAVPTPAMGPTLQKTAQYTGGRPALAKPAQPAWNPSVLPRPNLNWQQQMMKTMPPGMRQMYNGRPMTNSGPLMPAQPSMTRRGQPVGSRVNLQRNQFPRAGY